MYVSIHILLTTVVVVSLACTVMHYCGIFSSPWVRLSLGCLVHDFYLYHSVGPCAPPLLRAPPFSACHLTVLTRPSAVLYTLLRLRQGRTLCRHTHGGHASTALCHHTPRQPAAPFCCSVCSSPAPGSEQSRLLFGPPFSRACSLLASSTFTNQLLLLFKQRSVAVHQYHPLLLIWPLANRPWAKEFPNSLGVQRNKRADGAEGVYDVVWPRGEKAHSRLTGSSVTVGVGLVDALQPGDRVAVLARAQASCIF